MTMPPNTVHTRHLGREDRIQPPPGKLTPTQAALNVAADEGLLFRCSYGDEVDYTGPDPLAAWEALCACDEMRLTLFSADGKTNLGWAFIIFGNGMDDMVDYGVGSWFDDFWNKNNKDFD